MAQPCIDPWWRELETTYNVVEKEFLQAMKTEDQRYSRAKLQPTSRGRVAILNMSQRTQRNQTRRLVRWATDNNDSPDGPDGFIFQDPDHFKHALQYFHKSSDTEPVKFFAKQLVVVEDIVRDWVEKLGQAFCIPPRVFANHWASPGLYISGEARLPLGQPPEDSFVLPYREVLPLNVIKKNSSMFTNTQFHVLIYLPDGK